MNWVAAGAGAALEEAGAGLEDEGAGAALLVDGTGDRVVGLLDAPGAGGRLPAAAVLDEDDRVGSCADDWSGDDAAGAELAGGAVEDGAGEGGAVEDGAVEGGIDPAGVGADTTADAVMALGASTDEMSWAARVSETP